MRWTPAAAGDLARIARRIRLDNPSAAERVAAVLFQAGNRLSTLSARGRPGRIPNTRELIFPGWPYILVHELGPESVDILRIFHAAQDWP